MVHPLMMTQFPSRHAITTSISTHYASMFRVAPKHQYGSRHTTKIQETFLICHEFQLLPAKLGLGRGSSYLSLVK